MEALQDVRILADRPYQRHDHGIVYAIRMTPDDLGGLDYDGARGFEATVPVSSSKIVEKAIIPVEAWTPLSSNLDDYEEKIGSGLIAALRVQCAERK
jgi:hypothetical protein